MSVSLAFTLTLAWMLLLFVTTLFNYFKSQRDMFISSVFILAMYVVGHLANSLWLMSLPLGELLKTHYLFYAGMQVLLAVGLFWINRNHLRVIMTITIVLLGLEALVTYAVHVDRNILALNGALIPNTQGSGAWLLWDIQSFISQITNFSVFLSVALPKIYQLKEDEDNTVAFDVLQLVEAYLAKFAPDSVLRRKAQAYLYYSAQGLCEITGEEADFDHYEVGTMLLNAGIRKCCYEPWRTKPVTLFGRFVYWLRS